ncbi:MAG: hypothetical protein PHE78_07060 [Candidatus Gastranaerophilales bacterium]|nr:hypothetical protein [Candidatus Gastranaerophilales bacterium]
MRTHETRPSEDFGEVALCKAKKNEAKKAELSVFQEAESDKSECKQKIKKRHIHTVGVDYA